MPIGIAGFLLSCSVSSHLSTAQYLDGIFDGISWGGDLSLYVLGRFAVSPRSVEKMRLTDVFVRTVKFKGAGNGKGEKHSDGGGLYLLVTKTGKYWRLDYRYLEKRKTLAVGVYP